VMPLRLADEPASFDAKVRRRGLSAIAELVGQPPLLKRTGPRRKKIANQPAQIPADAFPDFWREALADLEACYGRLCAFLSLYIEPATGFASVDHMIPKSRRWDLVYEWSNYRLCAGLINAKKNDLVGVLDPCEIEAGWFALEFVG
jgi:hypothetical protein